MAQIHRRVLFPLFILSVTMFGNAGSWMLCFHTDGAVHAPSTSPQAVESCCHALHSPSPYSSIDCVDCVDVQLEGIHLIASRNQEKLCSVLPPVIRDLQFWESFYDSRPLLISVFQLPSVVRFLANVSRTHWPLIHSKVVLLI